MRNFIEEGLQRTSQDYSGKKIIKNIASLNLRGGPKELSQNLDKYLYGDSENTQQE